MNTYSVLILDQTLIVTADSNKEQQRRDVLEAMDPLFAFRPLSSNVKHAVGQRTEIEDGLCDAGGLQTGTEDILV